MNQRNEKKTSSGGFNPIEYILLHLHEEIFPILWKFGKKTEKTFLKPPRKTKKMRFSVGLVLNLGLGALKIYGPCRKKTRHRFQDQCPL